MPRELISTHIYRYPDGKNCAEKTLHTVKAWGFWGLWASAFDLVGISSPSTVVGAASRVVYINAPIAVGATVFASGGCIIGNLRGKDGPLNHVLAGLLSGASIAAYTGRVGMGVRLGMILALGGGLFKSMQASGLKIFPIEEHKEQGMFHHFHRYYGPGTPDEPKLPPTYT
ncbi:hypothetical protein LSAT2_013092 [Lamellibrachia satsuma]|nr:hypothetical protein LSAT2_013092 [Lamellibrachia satsuma]